MTAPSLVWQAECAHCQQKFSTEQMQEHLERCEVRLREHFKASVERPRAWTQGVGLVREIFGTASTGEPVRRYFVGTTDQLVTRSQLVALRDLITLALEESPEPVAESVTSPPASVPDATGAA